MTTPWPSSSECTGATMKKKCIFYDVKHSNNSARVRLWLMLQGGLDDHIQILTLTHADLDGGGKLVEVNPLKKVPAFVTDNGLNLFESFVILSYLEDRFGDGRFLLTNVEDRALVQLFVRIHDIYISSPNCTQPNFSHTQGCMYLDPYPTPYTPERRTMPDPAVRASKLKEIYERLCWMEENIRSEYMVGDRITHADITWYPTCIFMEILLPYVFDWATIFHEKEHFPRLTRWFETCTNNEHFASIRDDISGVLKKQQRDGRFDNVRKVARDNPDLKWKYM